MDKIIGIIKRCYPVEDVYLTYVIEDSIVTTTVLVEGGIGDYAAYTGHGDPEWVARMGDKISFAEACCHFGPLEREKYRN